MPEKGGAMKPLGRVFAVLAVTASLLTIAPPAMATGRIIFIGGGTGGCFSDAFYGVAPVDITKPPKLWRIEVSDACTDAFQVFVTASDGTFTSMAVAPGLTTIIRPWHLWRAGLLLVEVVSVGSGQTTDVSDPCDLNTTYVVQPTGRLAPWSSVC
jgi:hypothetical protein